jgi:hypothetical protein
VLWFIVLAVFTDSIIRSQHGLRCKFRKSSRSSRPGRSKFGSHCDILSALLAILYPRALISIFRGYFEEKRIVQRIRDELEHTRETC